MLLTEYFLEHFLQIKIMKFEELPDDTPIDLDIPIGFGVMLEAKAQEHAGTGSQ